MKKIILYVLILTTFSLNIVNGQLYKKRYNETDIIVNATNGAVNTTRVYTECHKMVQSNIIGDNSVTLGGAAFLTTPQPGNLAPLLYLCNINPSNGNTNWVQFYNTDPQGAKIIDVKTFSNGDFLILADPFRNGSYWKSNGEVLAQPLIFPGCRYFLLRISSDGKKIIWSQQYIIPYMSGEIGLEITNNDASILVFSNSGTTLRGFFDPMFNMWSNSYSHDNKGLPIGPIITIIDPKTGGVKSNNYFDQKFDSEQEYAKAANNCYLKDFYAIDFSFSHISCTKKLHNNNFLVAGTVVDKVNPDGTTTYLDYRRFFIARINSLGQVLQYNYYYSNSCSDYMTQINQIEELSDGGIVLIGDAFTSTNTSGNKTGYGIAVTRLDANLNILWSNSYRRIDNAEYDGAALLSRCFLSETGQSIKETRGGNLLVIGQKYNMNGQSFFGGLDLLKLTNDGQLIWGEEAGDTSTSNVIGMYERFSDFIKTKNDEYLIGSSHWDLAAWGRRIGGFDSSRVQINALDAGGNQCDLREKFYTQSNLYKKQSVNIQRQSYPFGTALLPTNIPTRPPFEEELICSSPSDPGATYSVKSPSAENIFKNSGGLVYPNPTNTGIFKVNYNGNAQVEIYNSIGQRIFFQEELKQGNSNIDISKEHNGIYTIKLKDRSSGKVISDKIVKL